MQRLIVLLICGIIATMVPRIAIAQPVNTVILLHRSFYNALLAQDTDLMQRILSSSPIITVRDKIQGLPDEKETYFVDVAGERCLKNAVKFLFARGARGGSHSANAVRTALSNGCVDVAQDFVENRFSVNDLRPSSNSYITYAMEIFENNNTEIMKFLIKSGIIWSEPMPHRGSQFGGPLYTHMLMAGTLKTREQIDMLEHLIDSHGEMDPTATWIHPNEQGYNMLDVVHYRCGEASEEIAEAAIAMLLSKGFGPPAVIEKPFNKSEDRGRYSFACWSIMRKDKFGGNAHNAVPAQPGPHKVIYPF